MGRQIRRTAVLMAVLLLILTVAVPAHGAADSPLSDFSYTADPVGRTVTLHKYIGSRTTVEIPGTYAADGVVCQVVLDSETLFQDNTAITSVKLHPDIRFTENSMARLFSNCSSLTQVDLSGLDTSSVTDMSYLFYQCSSLESLELSGLNTSAVTSMRSMFSLCTQLSSLTGYESWDTGALENMYQMFNQVEKLQTIDLSRWDLDQVKNTGWCFQMCKAKYILLPENLAVISAGFLNHAVNYTGRTFTVPAGVKKIGYAHTLYDFATNAFTEFIVAEGNPHYASIDGILYSADGTEMLAVPRAKKFGNGTYELPEGVTFLGELSFSRNYNIQKLVLPDSYELGWVPLYDPAYIVYEDTGNLNAGLNLNIAIYCYTGITDYAVKESNPRYTSLDGIIYSKDMTAVVAVPSRYNKKLVIPEGVTEWQTGAMWCAGDTVDGLMSKCTGVSIPASLTDIATDQLDKLNRLNDRFSGFRITLHKDNPAYYIADNGDLTARLKLEDASVALEQTVYTYDGSSKEPAVAVTFGDAALTEGTDYSVTYANNTDAGQASVQVSGMGDYYGTAELTFTIEKAVPEYTVPAGLTALYGQTLKELPLPAGFTWTEAAVSVGNAGENGFTVCYDSGNANYQTAENIPVTITVLPKEITADFSAVAARYAFTGKPITPPVTVSDGGMPVPEAEYLLIYSDNQGFGRAVITVTDREGGNYTVTGSTSFAIIPGWKLLAGSCLGLLIVIWGLAVLLGRSRKRPKNTP